jgi:hypothetical protein
MKTVSMPAMQKTLMRLKTSQESNIINLSYFFFGGGACLITLLSLPPSSCEGLSFSLLDLSFVFGLNSSSFSSDDGPCCRICIARSAVAPSRTGAAGPPPLSLNGLRLDARGGIDNALTLGDFGVGAEPLRTLLATCRAAACRLGTSMCGCFRLVSWEW